MAGKPIRINIVAEMTGDGIAKAQSDLDKLKAKLPSVTDEVEKHGRAHKTLSDLSGNAGTKINELAQKFTSQLGPAGEVAQSAIEKVTGKIGGIGVGTAAAAGGVAILATALFKVGEAGVEKFLDLAEKTKHFQEAAGTSAQDSSILVDALDDLGIGADNGAAAMARLAKTSELTPSKLEDVGVAIAHTKDGAYDAYGTLENVAEAFANTNDQGQKAAIGSAAFGKSWAALAPLLNGGKKNLEEIRKEAEKLGIVMSQDDVDAAFKFKQNMVDLHDSLDGVKIAIGRGIVPEMANEVGGLVKISEKTDEVTRGHLNLSVVSKAAFQGMTFGIGPLIGKLNDSKDATDKATGSTIELSKAAGTVTTSLSPFKDVTKATKDEVNEYNQSVKDAQQYMKEYDQKVKDATKSQQDLQKAQQDAAGVQLSLEQATLDLNGAFQTLQDKTDAVNVAVRDHGAASKEARDAQHDLDGQVITTKQSIIDVGKAAVDAAQNQAAANGTTLNAEQASYAQRDALQAVARQLDPASPLAVWLNGYISQLNAIPATKHTTVTTDYEENYHVNLAPGQTGGNQVRASGGQTIEDKPYLVGENGPEMFVPDSNGTIVPAAETRNRKPTPSLTGGAASSGSATLHIENINISNGTPADVRRELDWLIRTRL